MADGRALYRDMPWRQPDSDGSFNAYNILVSEIMLQQTQVSRVVPKYAQFLQAYPNCASLARASLADVLMSWSGLGYNRRAKYLHQAAQYLANESLWGVETLVQCKGVGPNTAKAVVVYAYNEPRVFIETNIRTVFIHTVFSDSTAVPDADILSLLSGCMQYVESPRHWYWALMDLGAHIKATHGNTSQKSATYKVQSRFAGSLRQLRGAVMRSLMSQPMTPAELKVVLQDERLVLVLDALCSEGLIYDDSGKYYLGQKA